MTRADAEPPSLFEGVTFTVLRSDQVSANDATEIIHTLVKNGAQYRELVAGRDIDDVTKHTHIISSHIDFPQYDDAIDADCYVVKRSWVDQSLVKGRQAQARQHSPDPALIFQDVIVTFGDLPQGDRDAITAGVLAMGGLYSSAMTKLVTHIVSLTEESDKVQITKTMKLNTKVVLPHWFDDCLRLGRKISETPYMLPDPKILDTTVSQQGIGGDPDMGDAKSAMAELPHSLALNTPPGTPKRSNRTSNISAVFRGKAVFFCQDLNIHVQLAETLRELVERAGGILTANVQDCDTFVGHYRDGQDYDLASREGKTIGNLAWFYSVMLRNRWHSPLKKLLHFPVPRGGIPGFSDFKITLSNYTGDARVYLENLIRQSGAEYTKVMRQDNTHLITAHMKSSKCEAAQEWNINIINHLWLEESYAKGALQSLTAPRYTVFPACTNLSEVVGQTKIINKESSAEVMPPLRGGWTNVEKHRPSPRKTVGGVIVHHGDDESERGDARTTTSEKENVVPSTARASKIRAAASLERAMEDVAMFEKEKKRKGGLLHGRARGSDTSDANGFHEVSSVAAAPPAKRQKQGNTEKLSDKAVIKYSVMTTGDGRWTKDIQKESRDLKALSAIGIKMVDDPFECDVLCAPKILRTRKFVMALAAAPTVVSIEFLNHALEFNEVKPPSSCKLVDTESEKAYGFKLSDALGRAATNDRKLLRGWTVYLTEKVKGGFETYKDIVQANGGIAILYKGRDGMRPPQRRKAPQDDPEAGPEQENQGGDAELEYAYLVSTEEDGNVWPAFRKLAKQQRLTARLVKTDWLLSLALSQRILCDTAWLLH